MYCLCNDILCERTFVSHLKSMKGKISCQVMHKHQQVFNHLFLCYRCSYLLTTYTSLYWFHSYIGNSTILSTWYIDLTAPAWCNYMIYVCSSTLEPVPSSPVETVQSTTSTGQHQTPQVSLPPVQLPPAVTVAVTLPKERQSSIRPASHQEPQPASATGKILCSHTLSDHNNKSYWTVLKQLLCFLGLDQSSSGQTSIPSMPVPLTSAARAPSPLSQPPLILQPLASPLQVGVPPMSLPIILNPALIEATSPVPLLSNPAPASSSDEVK